MSALRYEVLPSKPTDHDPITVEEFHESCAGCADKHCSR